MTQPSDHSAAPAARTIRRAGQGANRVTRLVGAALAACLLVAMALSTRWLTPAQVNTLTPKAFDPAVFAAEKFPEIKTKVIDKAVDFSELGPALTANLAGAGAKYCVDAGSGKWGCAVKVTGTVKTVDENWIVLDTPNVPGWTVRVPVGPALSGNALRDVTGDIKFGDFTDQTTYQFVADQLRDQARKKVIEPLGDRTKLSGKTITVTGAWMSGGAPNQFIIQPVQIEAQS